MTEVSDIGCIFANLLGIPFSLYIYLLVNPVNPVNNCKFRKSKKEKANIFQPLLERLLKYLVIDWNDWNDGHSHVRSISIHQKNSRGD